MLELGLKVESLSAKHKIANHNQIIIKVHKVQCSTLIKTRRVDNKTLWRGIANYATKANNKETQTRLAQMA